MILHKLNIAGAALAALLISSCSSSNPSTDWENDNMKGKVKMVTERHFMALQDFDGAKKGDPFSPDEGEFDSRWTYNENGYRSSYTKLQVGEEDTIWTTSMVYDSINPALKTLEITDGEDGIVCRYQVTHYNKDNKPDTISTTDGRGTLMQRIIATYEKDQETLYYYTADGKLGLREVSTLDDENPIKVESYDGEGKRQRVMVSLWNKNLRDSVVFYDGEGKDLTHVGFDYDKNGNCINQHGLDEHGEALRIQTWKYEYDEQGNWTRRIEYLDGKPTFIVERHIEYYK